jgi:DNA-binding transcriptional ArsR family regulator
MTITQIDLDEKSRTRTAALAKAIAHPVRIAILQFLAGRSVCACGDITDVLPLAQSTVSQHLKVLKEAGLIKGEVEGVRTCYCIDRGGVEELNRHFNGLLRELNDPTTNPCC